MGGKVEDFHNVCILFWFSNLWILSIGVLLILILFLGVSTRESPLMMLFLGLLFPPGFLSLHFFFLGIKEVRGGLFSFRIGFIAYL
ncbi:hypothetical protein GDO81_020671 [Engystomops pustulosus]|uniref:NADH dehydrogenase subunit 4 n=1 Tax=Engystomops pustulosus TaxID=76066 RepID=A0AAV6Z7W8_ENGPU|nr:hypothetical protein GDO81_020671 [Engystomops pustulosus]